MDFAHSAGKIENYDRYLKACRDYAQGVPEVDKIPVAQCLASLGYKIDPPR